MPRAGPRRIYKYSRDFKLAAVRLSQQADLQVQAVAAARDRPAPSPRAEVHALASGA